MGCAPPDLMCARRSCRSPAIPFAELKGRDGMAREEVPGSRALRPCSAKPSPVAARTNVEEIRSLGNTLSSWRTEILAHPRERGLQRSDGGSQPLRQASEPRPRVQAVLALLPARLTYFALAASTGQVVPAYLESALALPIQTRRARLPELRDNAW